MLALGLWQSANTQTRNRISYSHRLPILIVPWRSTATDEDAGTPRPSTWRNAASAGDPFKKDNFKGATLRLMAQVTARQIKHG